jgi:hypothetical protein
MSYPTAAQALPRLFPLLLAGLLLSGCKPPPGGQAKPGPPGTTSSGGGPSLPSLTTYPATPQAVMEAVQSAARRGAWREYVQYLDPETIDSAARGYLDAAVDFAASQKSGAKSPDAGGDQAASAIVALLKDRGITAEMLARAASDAQERAQVEKLVGDRAVFVADVLTRTGGGPSRKVADAKLENWDVKGQTASATMAVEQEASASTPRSACGWSTGSGKWRAVDPACSRREATLWVAAANRHARASHLFDMPGSSH